MPDGSAKNLIDTPGVGYDGVSALIKITEWLVSHLQEKYHRKSIADALKLAVPGLDIAGLCAEPVNDRGYSRNLLYADPDGRFSILGLKWLPGATTPIHGHNAWGCVGILTGELVCETYAYRGGLNRVALTGETTASRGCIATVRENPMGIHRISNRSDTPALSLHIYGMDLSKDDMDINVPYNTGP